jgi:hypothetical protein
MHTVPRANLNGHAGWLREFVAKPLRRHPLPAFLIIGAQKGGTTSLASYLAAHPEVVSPAYKEVHYFDLNYGKGSEWYRSHFPIGGRRRLKSFVKGQRLRAIDATPYYLLHPQVASRVARAIPSARIVLLLRDPVSRAYSHYHHEVRLGTEKLSFADALDAEPARTSGEVERMATEPLYEGFNYQHFTYLRRGIYSEQLRCWLRYFRSEQFLVLSSEQFFENPAVGYRKALKFLGLTEWELPAYPPEHTGKYSPMPPEIRKRLIEYYAPHNRILREDLNSYWPGTGDEVVARFSG